MISRTRLYELRHPWRAHKDTFTLEPSGGAPRPDWPAAAHTFLTDFLPHCQPLNCALLADELARRHNFQRSRAAVAAYVRQHFPQAFPAPKRGPKPRRRWQCAALGELWQHDSSPHPWWPADAYPVLLLTLDDHSRKILAGSFVRSDTTWDHFPHLRPPIETCGLPAGLYPDGLSLFGHRSPADRRDTHSQFQRAFTALGTAHRVAPDAPAKGKIERRFDTFPKRLVSLLAYEKITDCKNANALLQTQIAWHNQHPVCRTTGRTPNAPTLTTPSGQTSWPTTDANSPVRFCSNNYSAFERLPTAIAEALDTPTDWVLQMARHNKLWLQIHALSQVRWSGRSGD